MPTPPNIHGLGTLPTRVTPLDLEDAHVIVLFRSLRRELTALERTSTPSEKATLLIAARQVLANLTVIAPDDLRQVLGLESADEE